MSAVSDRPASEGPDQSPAWGRLEDQIDWYGHKAAQNQSRYRQIKVLQLITAAGVPVAAALNAEHWILAALGGVILVLEGLQQLGQYHDTWISYRGTSERLKREKFLYLSKAGIYARKAGERRLAERVETLVAHEHGHWEMTQEDALRAEEEESGS